MGSTARLSQIVEGVEFTVQHGLTTIHAVVLRDALQGCFGATELPATWLEAYGRHRAVIVGAGQHA